MYRHGTPLIGRPIRRSALAVARSRLTGLALACLVVTPAMAAAPAAQRVAGSKPGYSYSNAMKKAGFTWDEGKVAAYIAKPQGLVPGNKMSFAGVVKDDVRDNIVAYLKDATK